MHFKNYKNLLAPPLARAAYSDRTAWLMSEMSKFAYVRFEDDSIEYKKLEDGIEEASFNLVDTFNENGTQAFLAMRETNEMAILAFRGTEIARLNLEAIIDIFTDLDARFYEEENGTKIHKGFNRSFENVKEKISESLKKIGNIPVYITGHSLGGALALVATHSFNADNIAACYTFGSPKVGNDEFDDMIKVPIYRVVNDVDLVPFLPFTPILWALAIYKKARPLVKFIKTMSAYEHHGDGRMLKKLKSPDDKIQLKQGYCEFTRSCNLIRGMYNNRNIGPECHSLEEYCDKLGRYAVQRL